MNHLACTGNRGINSWQPAPCFTRQCCDPHRKSVTYLTGIRHENLILEHDRRGREVAGEQGSPTAAKMFKANKTMT